MEGLIGAVLGVAKYAMATLGVLGGTKVEVFVAIFAAVKILGALYNYCSDTGDTSTVKILSYNVWNRNDMELQKRMEALGNLIESHVPDVICFQLSKLPVNSISFIPFRNSGTQVKMSMVEIEVFRGKPLVVATSHLKSPDPAHNEMFSKERVAHAQMALDLLKNYPNVIFGGDMNWYEEVDGKFPLLDGWVDAWTELRPRESGWTFDTELNPWLASRNHHLQKRLDRFICNFKDFKLKKIDIIGREAIQSVVPSYHYGLLLEVQTK